MLLAIFMGDILDWNMNFNIFAISLLYIGIFLGFFTFFMFSVQMIVERWWSKK